MPGQFGIFTNVLPWLAEGQQVSPQVDRRGRLIVSSGDNNTAGVLTVTMVELDTAGGIVPVEKGRSYTYDSSGNIQTETVADGALKWVRTHTYQMGQEMSDSGWVKQ